MQMLRNRRGFLVAGLVTLSLGACSVFSAQTELLRSDMPLAGLDASITYTLEGNPEGTSEVNEIRLSGMNTESPFPQLKTTFNKVSDTVRTQEAVVTLPDGKPVTALASTSQKINFGLSQWLEVTVTTNDFRDAKGERTCSAKVRMNYKPNAEQFLKGDVGKGWDAIWYYFVPCENDKKQQLDLKNATFHALVISEQWTPRITGKPLFFNRGRSITIVGGQPSRFPAGWWLSNAKKGSDYSILGANKLVRGLVKDIYGDGGDARFSFNPKGPYSDSQLVYSAGDADVFFSVDRVFLNRQTDYVVNFRSSPGEPWTQVYVKPKYNFEWNDWAQGWENFKDFNPLNVDDKLDENGIPTDPNDPIIKEIETNGCQNCPNATLEQIQIVDAKSGQPLYAMTIRGYLGAKNSLVLFGNLPGSGMLQTELAKADAQRQSQQLTCPQRYDDEGNLRTEGEQWSAENCAAMLREGAMWQYLTENPDDFGFDLVGQFNVRDNGTWDTACSGGETSYCWLVPIERKLNAVYMFNEMDTRKPWTAMQVLGEVGVRTLGLSYASDAYAGSGMLFALAQPLVRDLYNNGLGENKEMIFALDARASQLPGVLGEAGAILK